MSLKIFPSSFPFLCCPPEARIDPPQTRKYLPALHLFINSYNSANVQVPCCPLLHSISNSLELCNFLRWGALFLGKQQACGHLGALDKSCGGKGGPGVPNHPWHASRSPHRLEDLLPRPRLLKEVWPFFSPPTGELCTITSCNSLPTTLKTDAVSSISFYQQQMT